MLAALAILAMFAFVLADSLPRLFNDYARPTTVDRVVVKVNGSDVRRSDLELRRIQRSRANYVLSQLGLNLGGAVAPYFDSQTFGPTDDGAMVDALLLERKANAMGIPRSAELARNWIFEQARVRHELFRGIQPTLPAFDPIDIAEQLQFVFDQSFGRELTVTAFLAEVSEQVRILQTLELLSQTMETPLDAFELYSNRLVEVEAQYVAFPVEEYLDSVSSPDSTTLREFYDQRSDRLPDPTTGKIGFKVPRRIKVEYLVLGLNAIDLLREQIRGEPLAEEIRSANGFEEDVLARYQQTIQERESASFYRALPVNPFAESDAEGAIALSYPPEFEERFVSEQIDLLVQERLRDRIEDVFEPVKQAMNDFSYGIPGDLDDVQTGLEEIVDRESLPDLDAEVRRGTSGQSLIEVLGEAVRRDEGIGFVKIGLTRELAVPETFQQLMDPEGFPNSWRDYFSLARLEWADAPYVLLRSVQRLTRSIEGVERPDPTLQNEVGTFAEVLFEENGPLFDPREFTDSEGRRYLVWKTLDLPEGTRPFNDSPEELIVSSWKREEARQLALKAAEGVATSIRKAVVDGVSPADAINQIASESGLVVRSTGPRRRVDSLSAYAPINAGPEFRDSLFRLGDSGEDAAAVAPDFRQEIYYVLSLFRRGDSSLGGDLLATSEINFENALSNLEFIMKSDSEREAELSRLIAVIDYLRKEAGIEDDWTPEEPGRG